MPAQTFQTGRASPSKGSPSPKRHTSRGSRRSRGRSRRAGASASGDGGGADLIVPAKLKSPAELAQEEADRKAAARAHREAVQANASRARAKVLEERLHAPPRQEVPGPGTYQRPSSTAANAKRHGPTIGRASRDAGSALPAVPTPAEKATYEREVSESPTGRPRSKSPAAKGNEVPGPGTYRHNARLGTQEWVSNAPFRDQPQFSSADRFHETKTMYQGATGAGSGYGPEWVPGPGAYGAPEKSHAKVKGHAFAHPPTESLRGTDGVESVRSPGPGQYKVGGDITNPVTSTAKGSPKAPFSMADRSAASLMYYGPGQGVAIAPRPSYSRRGSFDSVFDDDVGSTRSIGGAFSPVKVGYSFGVTHPRKEPPRAAAVRKEQEDKRARLQEQQRRKERQYERVKTHLRAGMRAGEGGDYSWLHESVKATGGSFGSGPRFGGGSHNDATPSPGPAYALPTMIGRRGGPSHAFPKSMKCPKTPGGKERAKVPGPGAYNAGTEDDSYSTYSSSTVPTSPIKLPRPGRGVQDSAFAAVGKDRGAAPPPPPPAVGGARPSGVPALPPAQMRKFGKFAKLPSAPSHSFPKTRRDDYTKQYGGSNDLNRDSAGRESPGPSYDTRIKTGSGLPSWTIPKEKRLENGAPIAKAELQSSELAEIVGTIEYDSLYKKKGQSFTHSGRDSTAALYMGSGFSARPDASPGPVYDTNKSSFGRDLPYAHSSPRPSFPKAERTLSHVSKDAMSSPGPGAHNVR